MVLKLFLLSRRILSLNKSYKEAQRLKHKRYRLTGEEVGKPDF